MTVVRSLTFVGDHQIQYSDLSGRAAGYLAQEVILHALQEFSGLFTVCYDKFLVYVGVTEVLQQDKSL